MANWDGFLRGFDAWGKRILTVAGLCMLAYSVVTGIMEWLDLQVLFGLVLGLICLSLARIMGRLSGLETTAKTLPTEEQVNRRIQEASNQLSENINHVGAGVHRLSRWVARICDTAMFKGGEPPPPPTD